MDNLKPYQTFGVIALLAAFSGFFGWIYEFIFYFINYGCQDFYLQGGNFLPWINIYAIGACLIVLFTSRFRENPYLVFLSAVLISGLVEYLSGWFFYTFFDGLRFWDYNTEIWNVGNIGGFICLRSILFFGVSSLSVVYLILPLFEQLAKTLSRKTFLTLTISLLSIILIDEFYNLLAPVFGLPTAHSFYTSLGLKYAAFFSSHI